MTNVEMKQRMVRSNQIKILDYVSSVAWGVCLHHIHVNKRCAWYCASIPWGGDCGFGIGLFCCWS